MTTLTHIHRIQFNWFPYRDHERAGQDYSIYEVDKLYPEKGKVTHIEEHAVEREGDRCFYDVHFDSGAMERIFNPNHIFYKPA